jgi:hypothetical protein
MKQFFVTAKELRVIETDLKRALAYVDLFIDSEERLATGQGSSALEREAFSLAAVVAYCRPFTKCEIVGEEKRRAWIPDDLTDALSNRKLHDVVVNIRDKRWAHTDETAHGLPDIENRASLPRASAIPFKALIGEILSLLTVTP